MQLLLRLLCAQEKDVVCAWAVHLFLVKFIYVTRQSTIYTTAGRDTPTEHAYAQYIYANHVIARHPRSLEIWPIREQQDGGYIKGNARPWISVVLLWQCLHGQLCVSQRPTKKTLSRPTIFHPSFANQPSTRLLAKKNGHRQSSEAELRQGLRGRCQQTNQHGALRHVHLPLYGKNRV